jgi:hypothetical protein
MKRCTHSIVALAAAAVAAAAFRLSSGCSGAGKHHRHVTLHYKAKHLVASAGCRVIVNAEAHCLAAAPEHLCYSVDYSSTCMSDSNTSGSTLDCPDCAVDVR